MKKTVLLLITIIMLVSMFGCDSIKNIFEIMSANPDDFAEEYISETPDHSEQPQQQINFSIKEMFDEVENTNWDIAMDDIIADTNTVPIQHPSLTGMLMIEAAICKINDCELKKAYLFYENNTGSLESYWYGVNFSDTDSNKYTDLYNEIKKEMQDRYQELVYDKSVQQNDIFISQCFTKSDSGFILVQIIETTQSNSFEIRFFSKDSADGNLTYKNLSE